MNTRPHVSIVFLSTLLFYPFNNCDNYPGVHHRLRGHDWDGQATKPVRCIKIYHKNVIMMVSMAIVYHLDAEFEQNCHLKVKI